MSGEQPAVAVEEGFLCVSNQQLDDEEFSWQYGSSDSFSYSQYIHVEKSTPRLDVKDFTAMVRKAEECGKSADVELEWDLLAHQQQLSLSSFEKRVDDHSDSHLDGAFAIKGGVEFQEPFWVQNGTEQMPSSEGCKYQWLLSQRFQCMPRTPKFGMQKRPCKLHLRRSDKRGVSSFHDGYCEIAAEQPEKLGEALCHSQTRARTAEKLATDAVTETEQLVKLLHRETNICRTYRERAHLLEVENLWLKACSEHKTEILPAFCNVSDVRSRCKFYKQGMSNGGTLVPTTIGLAFALGLSCASAGFMIGFCMGLVGSSQ